MSRMGYERIKRIGDLALSVTGLLLLWPFFVVLALWIRIDSPGPVLFRQERIGKDETRFTMLKFRTMRVEAPNDQPTHLLQNADGHITRAGRWLRRTSLDELPQLWNIVKGDMSFVGPRPALWNQDDLIAERDKYGANAVRPGLTGWAQINGRDELPIDVKAKMDGEYIQHMSLGFDVRCFIGTLGPVLRKDGIVEGGETKREDHPCC